MSIDTILKFKCNASWKKSGCQIIWIVSESRRKIQTTHSRTALYCVFFNEIEEVNVQREREEASRPQSQ